MSFNFKAKAQALKLPLTNGFGEPITKSHKNFDSSRYTSERKIAPLASDGSRHRRNEASSNTRLPSLHKLNDSADQNNKTRMAIEMQNILNSQTASVEGILRAMGDRLSSSLLSVYHTDLMEGLKYYGILKHNLDLNYSVVQGRRLDSEFTETIMSKSDYVIKDKLRELVQRIELDHFPDLIQQDQDSDEKLDSLLKDYSEVLNHVVIRAKNAGLNYVADSIEILWKFLVVCLDKLFGIKERQMRLIFNEEVQTLNHRIRFMESSMKDQENHFNDMRQWYENRLQSVMNRNRFTCEALNSVRQELEKWKSSVGEGGREDKDSLLGKFKQMQKHLYQMDGSINQVSEENFEQNKMVRTELLKSILGIFNRGFKSMSKSVGTQTDLSLSANSSKAYKFGLQEFIFPEEHCLKYFKHPFLPYLYKDPEQLAAKGRSEDQIQFIEETLDQSSLM